ncbi:MAG: D-alanyl-D-alanine carboxypeptidase [Clostridia bacterium]|nr:D-alanyl-D-alanine carboxypeptidase [Clostridia bacterium]
MKRCLILIVIAVCLFPAASASETLSVAAKGAVLIDGTSGRVLFRQNADEMLPMASTTKIMTALIALESCSLDETVVAGKNAAGVEGTSIYLSEGESLSMEHMLYGLMLRSGNDAAVAIAEHVSGSVPAFVEKMNARARVLNADAHFVNPNGLPASGHAASALGMARIMRAAMQIDEFRTITATERKIIPWVGNEFSRVLENKNRLLSTYDGANGGKTGYTKTAGRCLVFSAERDGLFLIGAVLNCPTWFDTAAEMLDYGFENFRMQESLARGQSVGEITVFGGASGKVRVVAGETLSAVIPVGARAVLRYDYDENVSAPIRKGDVVGAARLIVSGDVVGECPLIADSDEPVWNLAESIRRLLRNWVMLFQTEAR